MAEAENQKVQQINDISWEDVELRSVDSNEVLFLMCYPSQYLKVENNQSQIDEKYLLVKTKTKNKFLLFHKR